MIALGGCIKAPPVAYGITPDTGGHITYLMDEAFALARRHDVERVTIYTRLFDAPDIDPCHRDPVERIADKIDIVRVSSGDERYLSKEALARDLEPWTDAFLAALAQGDRPDILHAHFADAAMAALAARERFGIPVVYTAHSLGADKLDAMAIHDAGLERRLDQEGRAIREADAVIGSSRDECERQLLRYDGARPERIHQVPPGVDPVAPDDCDMDAARALIAPFLADAEKPFLLAIARPVEKKNLVPLVEAFGSNPALRKAANLVVLAGLRHDVDHEDGECAKVHRQLFEAVDRHDLYGEVAYPKRHDRTTVNGLYALARQQRGLFVNSALFEPYGLTIVEAAAHGLPVMVTDQGGPVDIIERFGHGIATDPRDGERLMRKAHALLGDTARWDAYSASGLAATRNNGWSVYADRFLKIASSLGSKVVHEIRPAADLLAICDIDNTLTGCVRGARRLRRLLDSKPGWRFGVATGRSLQQAEAILERWDLPRPSVMITSVGSEIYWSLPDGSRRADGGFAAHIAHGWNADTIDAALRDIAGIAPQPAVEQRRFKRSYLFDDAEAVARVRARLAALRIEARVVASHDRLLDILPPRAGKAAALFWVARRLGLSPAQVVAAGDSGNDEDMLEACPNAVLVANHEPAIAHLSTRSNVHTSRHRHAHGVIDGLIRASRSIERAMSA